MAPAKEQNLLNSSRVSMQYLLICSLFRYLLTPHSVPTHVCTRYLLPSYARYLLLLATCHSAPTHAANGS